MVFVVVWFVFQVGVCLFVCWEVVVFLLEYVVFFVRLMGKVVVVGYVFVQFGDFWGFVWDGFVVFVVVCEFVVVGKVGVVLKVFVFVFFFEVLQWFVVGWVRVCVDFYVEVVVFDVGDFGVDVFYQFVDE